jgi:hypothetical protein
MKIGLDIDGVLCNFPAGVIDRARMMGLEDHFPKCCHEVQSWHISEKFSEVMQDAWTNPAFWLMLPPLAYSLPLDFKPDCYITSRPIANWVSEEWLSAWKFPKADVITVSKPEEKHIHIAERRLDLFVDDYFETVDGLINRGINAILFEAPYQRGHEVAHLRKMKHLSEVNNGNW